MVGGEKTRFINLDNAATTPPLLSVESSIANELSEYDSVHRGSGIKSKITTLRFEESRVTIKNFINAHEDDYVVYVPNTTIGMNQLAFYFSHIKGQILVSDIEHSSSYLPWIFQEGRMQNTSQVTLEQAISNKTDLYNESIMNLGRERVITFKTKKDFTFDFEDIERKFIENYDKEIESKIKLLVVTGMSNVTGYKSPIKKLSRIAHKYGAMIVIDACQLIQHERVDMIDQEIDFLIFSGHKMFAPYGSGAIVGNKRIFDAFWPYQMGGGNFPYISEDGEVFRFKEIHAHDPGTPNYLGARSLHYAIKQLQKIGYSKIKAHENSLVNKTFNNLKNIKEITFYNYKNGDDFIDSSLLTFNIEGFSCFKLAEILNDFYAIGTRAGSFCVYEFSRRIKNIASDNDIVNRVKEGDNSLIPGCVRASFGLVNTEDDVDRFVKAMKEIVKNGVNFYTSDYSYDIESDYYNRTN